MNRNFYFSGTVRDNLVRKTHVSNEEINEYVKLLKLD